MVDDVNHVLEELTAKHYLEVEFPLSLVDKETREEVFTAHSLQELQQFIKDHPTPEDFRKKKFKVHYAYYGEIVVDAKDEEEAREKYESLTDEELREHLEKYPEMGTIEPME